MRLARLATADGVQSVRRGDAGEWIPIENPYAAFEAGRVPQDLGAAVTGELLAPCEPLVLVGIAQNGPAHSSPVQAWLKSPRTVTGSGAAVTLRRDAGTTVAEAEIAVVIGRETTGLTAETAHEFVLGITAVNDLSSPDRATHDPRNFESKSGDGYTPLGPWIDTAMDLDEPIALSLLVDGQPVAETSAAELPMSLRACLAYVANWTTLGPGDVIMMGAPHSQSPIAPGNDVDVLVGDIRLHSTTA